MERLRFKSVEDSYGVDSISCSPCQRESASDEEDVELECKKSSKFASP